MPGEKDMNYDIKLFDNMELTYGQTERLDNPGGL